MRKPLSLLLICFSLALIAVGAKSHAQQSTTTKEFTDEKQWFGPKVTFPITGMTVTEFCDSLSKIGQLLDPEMRILDVKSLGGERLQVTTGKRDGPLTGNGFDIFFEKKNGKWVETKRSRWRS